jgi:hypothetical protein
MAWIDNAVMYWHDGSQYRKITDHNRSPLDESVERIEKKQRMADGTLRRYTVAKKRTWSCNWESLPSKTGVVGYLNTADGGWAGQDIEAFHNTHDGQFNMQLRKGDGTVEVVTVMIADFSKTIVKRGSGIDLWNLSITLEEV